MQEKWLRENLNGEAVKRFEALISCRNNIIDTMSYENFRKGFQLGMMMVMEAVSENDAVLFELYSKRHKQLHLKIQGERLYFLAGRRGSSPCLQESIRQIQPSCLPKDSR